MMIEITLVHSDRRLSLASLSYWGGWSKQLTSGT